MINSKTLVLIIVVAVIFAVIMAFAADITSGWARALAAAAAFGVLGVLLSYLTSKRKKDS